MFINNYINYTVANRCNILGKEIGFWFIYIQKETQSIVEIELNYENL